MEIDMTEINNQLKELAENYKCDSDEIKIGELLISRLDDSNIWISCNDGEAGSFPEKDLEAAIMKFYSENF